MRGDEKRIVEAFAAWLRDQGWRVELEIEHVDLVGRKAGQTLYAEAKGRTKARRTDVDTLYGQILRRMPFDEDPNARLLRLCPKSSCGQRFR